MPPYHLAHFTRAPVWGLVLAFAASGCSSVSSVAEAPERTGSTQAALTGATLDCDVIVAGGTTAALATALTAAREGARTCLLEPTDWPGGQLTASGVPAIDYA